MGEFNSIILAIEALKDGKMVIVVDDENRENEGDFVIAADKITPKDIKQAWKSWLKNKTHKKNFRIIKTIK